MYKQVLPTGTQQKCMETSNENLHTDTGAERVNNVAETDTCF